MKNNYTTRMKKGDYIIDCDICGAECWASQSTLLPPDTGKGGLIVCPADVDKTHWGSQPYKVLAEKPVPVVRYDETTFADVAEINFNTNNPINHD